MLTVLPGAIQQDGGGRGRDCESSIVHFRQRIVGGIAREADGAVDYADDFFGRKAFLTVSGQIQGEYYACALSNIYTFGPTFRAENSHTSRHLAEFWMIEPEMAFCDLRDDMSCAEDYVRFCCASILKKCRCAILLAVFPCHVWCCQRSCIHDTARALHANKDPFCAESNRSSPSDIVANCSLRFCSLLQI